MSTTIRDELDLSPAFGPFYWGFVFSMLLGGITILQAYIYFPRTNDKLSMQIVAGSMLVLDFASSILVAQSVYYYLVPHFGSPFPLASITNELSAECLVSTIITLISQLYFVCQIYKVARGTGSLIVPAAIGVFAICAFVFGTVCTATMFVHNHRVFANRNPLFTISFGLAKGFGVLTDIIATVALCTYLSSSRTRVTQTNSVITTLMHFIINRGALVTFVQSLFFIAFFVAPSHLYWLALHVNATKLYVNIFFVMLNARITLNKKIMNGAVIRLDDVDETYSRAHHWRNEINHNIYGGEKSQPVHIPVINITADFLEADLNLGHISPFTQGLVGGTK